MGRGPKKHMKRMFAPNHWLIEKKLHGVYATRPSTGPHKLRECIPISVLLRQRLKYAINGLEALRICRDKDNNIKVDNRIRRDHKFPLGLMDVVSIDKTGEHFRMLIDPKGRFMPIRIDAKEASFKLCKVKRKAIGKNKIPYIVTHDGRTIRFPHPDINISDSIKLNLETGEVDGVVKFDNNSMVFISGGNNIGRVGVLQSVERHPGSYDIAHVKDANGHAFATRCENCFAIGESRNSMITLPKEKGLRKTLLEERDVRLGREEDESEEEPASAAAAGKDSD